MDRKSVVRHLPSRLHIAFSGSACYHPLFVSDLVDDRFFLSFSFRDGKLFRICSSIVDRRRRRESGGG